MGRGSGQTIKHTIEYNYDKHCNQDRGLFHMKAEEPNKASWRKWQLRLAAWGSLALKVEEQCVQQPESREELVEPQPGELEGKE